MGWQATSGASAAAVAAETTWFATGSPGLEGFYELQSRGTDAPGAMWTPSRRRR